MLLVFWTRKISPFKKLYGQSASHITLSLSLSTCIPPGGGACCDVIICCGCSWMIWGAIEVPAVT